MEGVEYIPGLQFFPGRDNFNELKLKLKCRVLNATTNLLPGKYDVIAEAIERVMDKYWADRKFFVEVGDDNNCWIQVWDDKAVFRERDG